MSKHSDIDIDVADRIAATKLLKHIPAIIVNNDGVVRKHASGIYATNAPVDSSTGWCTIDYRVAEERNYYKIDFLNNSVYQMVKSNDHLDELLRTPVPWARLMEKAFCEQIVHIGNHYGQMRKMPEPINSLPRMAMFLSVIRPGKSHLIGKPWAEVAKTVWDRDVDGYTFRQSHAVAYAHLVSIHMVLVDQGVKPPVNSYFSD